MTNQTFIESIKDNVTDNVDVKRKRIFLYRIVANRSNQIRFVFVIFAIVMPLIFYGVFLNETIPPKTENHTCWIKPTYRVSCGRVNIDNQSCWDVNCCYDDDNSMCFHYLPPMYVYERFETKNTYATSQTNTTFGNKAEPFLALSITPTDEDNLKISFQTSNTSSNIIEPTSKFINELDDQQLALTVKRKENGDVLLSTWNGPLIASDGYWEWTVYMGEHLFGLGELYINIKGENVTKIIYKNPDDHTTIPSFMVYNNSRFHGLVIEHEGPLEVIILPSKLIILRSIGNKIELNLSIGITPRDVWKQQRKYTFSIPPYWALGPHICRDGNETLEEALKEYKEFHEDTDVEFASDCLHENLYLMLQDDLQADVQSSLRDVLNNASTHLVLSLPPHIVAKAGDIYNAAISKDVLYKDAKGNVFKGNYKNLKQEVAYPDFSAKSISDWYDSLKTFLGNKITKSIDGFILTDNWPAQTAFHMGNNQHFPYLTEEIKSAMSLSLDWDAKTVSNKFHYTQHNNYGSLQAELFTQNEFLATSSYNYGYKHAANVQNVNISWTNLKNAVRSSLAHSIFGSPLISFPVCGSTDFFPESKESTCTRWYLTAATMPLFRISSLLPRRDPNNLYTVYAQNIAKYAINTRHMLLPYYYSIIKTEELLIRPMFYEFFDDQETHTLDEQYMIGNALLVAQFFYTGASSVRVYLPPSAGTWFEFWGGRSYKNGWININVVERDWIMFLAQGNIVPLQFKDNLQTVWKIIIALDCEQDCKAEGQLNLEEGSLKFSASNTFLTIKNIKSAYKYMCIDMNVPNAIRFVNILSFQDIIIPDIDLCTVQDEITIPLNQQ